MVAVAQLIPKDPKEQATVLGVLRAHPELQEFITRATEKALEIFTDPQIHLDTVQYDEWDPPVRLIIEAPMSWESFEPAFDRFLKWLSPNPDYNRDLIAVLPLWAGKVGNRS